jgi:hypothetical protein
MWAELPTNLWANLPTAVRDGLFKDKLTELSKSVEKFKIASLEAEL